MINKEWKTSKEIATAIGNWESLEFTYEDRYLGKISHTFSPAFGKYEVLFRCNKNNVEEVVKYIKEQILHAHEVLE